MKELKISKDQVSAQLPAPSPVISSPVLTSPLLSSPSPSPSPLLSLSSPLPLLPFSFFFSSLTFLKARRLLPPLTSQAPADRMLGFVSESFEDFVDNFIASSSSSPDAPALLRDGGTSAFKQLAYFKYARSMVQVTSLPCFNIILLLSFILLLLLLL
eukprot:119008-Hanusia_phi.AAC.1